MAMVQRIEDYTNLPFGHQVGPSKVEECPYCHRRGLAVLINGVTWFKHATYDGYDPKGVFTLDWDSCPKDRPPVRTGPPDEILD
jgi:hypothetical protein